MIMIAAGLILLCSIVGIVYANLKLKDNKTAKMTLLISCGILAFVSAAFMLITLYFAWAVRMN